MADGGEVGPIVNIVGALVALGPARRDLVPLLYRWDNDFAMLRTQGNTPRPWTLEAEHAAYDADQGRGQYVSFAIYRRADWRPIGFTAWHDIDYRHGNARFVIGLGEADYRGQGYGTEATRLMLDYAFTALGLHSAMLTVYAYNLAGIRAYEKAGFREFGRQREAHRMGGKFWDMIYMGCLAREFTVRYSARFLCRMRRAISSGCRAAIVAWRAATSRLRRKHLSRMRGRRRWT